MGISNHLLAGSLIGLLVHNPFMAVPLAYASHFVMDALPHYGYPGSHDYASAVKEALKHKLAHYFSYATAATFAAITGYLIFEQQYFVLIIGLVAVMPDIIMTVYYLLFERRSKTVNNPFTSLNIKFHGRIQFERPWGIYVELLVFATLSFALVNII